MTENANNPSSYEPAWFYVVDPEGIRKFRSRLVELLKNDEGASLARTLLSLSECLFFKSQFFKNLRY